MHGARLWCKLWYQIPRLFLHTKTGGSLPPDCLPCSQRMPKPTARFRLLPPATPHRSRSGAYVGEGMWGGLDNIEQWYGVAEPWSSGNFVQPSSHTAHMYKWVFRTNLKVVSRLCAKLSSLAWSTMSGILAKKCETRTSTHLASSYVKIYRGAYSIRPHQ